MPPDASDTKRRILAAAHQEFADHGFAGARIDRIAEQAQANKRSIYVHFGPKERLFDLIITAVLSDLAVSVPFAPDDLPGYAVRLHDCLEASPDALRLMKWANLERASATDDEIALYAAKIAALQPRFGDRAANVLALILGLVYSWLDASPALLAVGAAPSAAVRRDMLIDSVNAMTSVFDKGGSR